MKRVENFDVIIDVIKDELTNQKISQKELAEEVGTHQPQINRMLNKKNAPSIELVLKVCEFLMIKMYVQPSKNKFV
jgi:transcriptional regulator with XRE-family HTH domain